MTGLTGIEKDIALLAARDHHDPHRVLGVHADGSARVVRVWRPEAGAVRVIPDGGTPVELPHRSSGLFEAPLPGEGPPPRYEVEVEHGGRVGRDRDPYSFLPTLGELDLHLVGEGRHQALWQSLGAHPREIDGTAGVAFAVWAPSARSVSIVGDWNGWDGRVHPMRSLGSSGVWELFVPAAGSGAHYKFEIRGADGVL
jgi:1,4-alpha-glucan branching enzyme